MNYFERIWESICYYEMHHGKHPDVMFISAPLFCELTQDLLIEYWSEEPFYKCCGIPVKMYTSSYKEYYLAEGAYWLE